MIDAEAASRQEKLSKIKVLLVDDTEAMRKLMRVILEGIGVNQIIDANDGKSAMQRVQEQVFDVIITDWKMQPIDGIELTRQIRTSTSSEQREIPIILISAHTEKNMVLAARDAGVNEILAKPVSGKALESRLFSALEARRDFIKTDHYTGPDRRRHHVDSYGGDERRKDAPPEAEKAES